MKIFTPAQMREFDREAVEKFKIPSIVLMENAALRVVEFCEAKFAPLREKRVLVACGKGNNAGDGFAIARHLCAAGCSVTVVLACKKTELSGDALVNFKALPPLVDVIAVGAGWPEVDLFIDALLGTGFSGEMRRGPVKTALEKYRRWTLDNPNPGRSNPAVVAVDVPSGLDAETGAGTGLALVADYTVTFADPKCGFFVQDGPKLCGEIWVGGIGTLEPQAGGGAAVHSMVLSRGRAGKLSKMLTRQPDAHKGDAGRVVVIGGSRGMSGAVALASRAALAAGAGLCMAMVPDAILNTVAGSVLEATTRPLACDAAGALTEEAFEDIARQWDKVQCVAVGPGIGRGEGTLRLVQRVVRECPVPLIIDADALYALRPVAEDVKARQAPTVLTPHPGEMAQLMGLDTKAIQMDRYGVVHACAAKYGATVVLKGVHSLVCEGPMIWVNLSGNPGMATGGSGDVLTGTIAAVYGALRHPFVQGGRSEPLQVTGMAAMLSVYAHGLAGDLAFETKGNGLVAGDIAAHLPRALKQLAEPFEPDEINSRLRRLQ